MSKQWDNIDQQEENVVSGMIALASPLGQNTILKLFLKSSCTLEVAKQGAPH